MSDFDSVNAVQDWTDAKEVYEAKCIFPWRDSYSGTIYQGCLNTYYGLSWCPTRLDAGDTFVYRDGDNFGACSMRGK